MAEANSSCSSNDNSPHDERLARLLVDLTERVQRGEPVDLDQICQDHPELADELRGLWGTILVADMAGSGQSPSQADESISDRQPATPHSSQRFNLPFRFGDFELLEEIGQGGMGIVFRARQVTLQREVAIKMILRGRLASDVDLRRFQAEAKAAAGLDHPGIVPVYEVGQHEGQPYFCMKYVNGQTLSELLAAGPIDPREAARILSAVARAVYFAHQQGVLHRDLKPSNVLLDEDGNPHITDFGLAKQDSEPTGITQTGAVIGTPAYMSPEQAGGDRGLVSHASDVFSLGTILYHMLTGRPPFQADSPVDVVLKVLEQDPVPPRDVIRGADRDLELIALKCLQKPPDLRYTTAGALADDLDAYLNDEPISASRWKLDQFLVRLFRETHHANVLENWGLLWMWHSLALLVACLMTNALYWLHEYGHWTFINRWYYLTLWTVGFWTWAAVFWILRRRMGPVLFVERQIAHVWAASTLAIALLFPLEWLLGLEVLTLSPVLGLIGATAFGVKAGILSGTFYIQSFVLSLTAFAMASFPDVAHLIFGVISAACFFVPGLKYYRKRRNRV